MNSRDFRAPYISQQKCWEEAALFRKRYWPSGRVPIEVLEIAEFDLDLDLRPILGLKDEADVDALLLSDWKTLVIDHRQYMDDRFANRLRFSVAHELGHYWLHERVFQTMRCAPLETWIRFVRDMPEKEYSFLEFHANEFAAPSRFYLTRRGGQSGIEWQ
jgi:hypothetical protein